MKVTKVETIRLDEFPNIIWLHVHTDQGLVGLGETFFGAQTVEAYLHESVAPYLIGKNPLHIDRHARALEEFEPYWFEDPLKADNMDALATYAAATDVPTVVSETLATRWSFREVLEAEAARIIMLDLS